LKKYEIKVTIEDAKEYVKNYFRKNDALQIPEHEHADGEEHDHTQEAENKEKRLDMIAEQVLKNEKEARQIFQVLYDAKLLALYREKLSITTKKATYKEFIDEAYKK
jgi:hypothetical protein